MTPNDANDIVKRILFAYPTQRSKMSREDLGGMTVAYTAGLIDLDFDVARAAVERATKTSEFIPTIARIRAEVGELAAGARRRGAEAWGDVLREIGRTGIYGEPRFADPLVAEAVTGLGWRQLCNADEIDPAPRARFCEAYDRLATSSRKDAQASRGAGARELGSGDGPKVIGALVAGLMPKEEP